MSSLRKSSSANIESKFYVARGEINSPKGSPKVRREQHFSASNWTKVGRKLGVIKVNLDDRNDFTPEDTAGLLEGEYMPSEEFPEGGPALIRNLETDPFLRIEDNEPENWQQSVPPESMHGLTPVQIKRQEHIYEFIATESKHCQVLKVIQKIFVEGMYKYLSMPKEDVEQIFPCIDELIDIHFRFLEQLRLKQAEGPVVDSIADILVQQFAPGETSQRWKEYYGTLSRQNNDAVAHYKDKFKNDPRFQQFVRQCAQNPLLKKKGIPECILFVTTRITKYPLLINALIKEARDLPTEQQKLRDADFFVKDILKDVNSRVAEKEREQRFLEIYKGIDAKSSVMYQGRKFKKADILNSMSTSVRKLMFEGVGVLQQRNRSLPVTVVVLSDILFFLHENNQKYHFLTPEGKPGVVAVSTLLATEKAGPSTKSLHLLSMYDDVREVYEIEIQQPPTRDDWITGIREAVDSSMGRVDDGVTAEAKRVEAKYMRMRHLAAELRAKDIELARLLEDKMRVLNDMHVVLGDPLADSPPDYVSLVREREDPYSKEDVLRVVEEASRWATAICNSSVEDGSGSTSSLSRSVSSAGERQSNAYTAPPGLPKRAETFSGFDQTQPGLVLVPAAKHIDVDGGAEIEMVTAASSSDMAPSRSSSAATLPAGAAAAAQVSAQGRHQAVANMTHSLNTLACMLSEHFTSLECLKSEVCEIRERSSVMGGRYKQNQQLEELRNLQDTMARDRRKFHEEREVLDRELESRQREMALAQAEVERGRQDVREQRDQLYRKLEQLKAQGIEIMGPNMSVFKRDVVAPPQPSSEEVLIYKVHESASTSALTSAGGAQQRTVTISPSNSSVAAGSMRKNSSVAAIQGSASSLSLADSRAKKDSSVSNLHLMSTTNEAKGDKPEIRQQIPVKLSKLSVSSGSTKEKSGKKMSSVSGMNKQSPNLSSSSSLSGSMGNIAKPIVEGSTSSMQQILPFKLSQASNNDSSSAAVSFSISSSTSSFSSVKRSSPKPGAYQRLPLQPPQPPQQQQQQPQQADAGAAEASHQRTGSSPALMPAAAGPRVVNTLPKSSSRDNNDPFAAANNNGEEKVIYF